MDTNHIYDNPAIHYYFGDLEGDKWTKRIYTKKRLPNDGGTYKVKREIQNSKIHRNYIDDFESELNTKTPILKTNQNG